MQHLIIAPHDAALDIVHVFEGVVRDVLQLLHCAVLGQPLDELDDAL